MTTSRSDNPRVAWLALVLLSVSTGWMWWPALHMPLWGDDYVFLLEAHATRLSGAPWWSDFWPSTPLRFWRPLSQEGYWRLMEAAFAGDARAMHVSSMLLHLLASTAVGLFALSLGRVCDWPRRGRTAVFAGLLYATLGVHLLPLHWAAAANSAMLVLFTSLALAAWTASACTCGMRRALCLATVPVLLVLALLSKESAVLIPLLLLILSAFARFSWWRHGRAATLATCALLVAAWLWLDARFTAHTDNAYALHLGGNVIRNGLSFLAWLLNVPREALRMAMLGDRLRAALWIAAVVIPMLAALFVVGRHGRSCLSRRQWLTVALFALVAYGPYFLFAWNSYAYYAAVSAILPVVVLTRLASRSNRIWLLAGLVALSSWIAVAGTRHAAQPALLARAHWGDRLLQQLAAQPVDAPLWVQTRDERRFYAVGAAGLAWRLRLPASAVHTGKHCPASAQHCLIITAGGHWHWRGNAATGRIRDYRPTSLF